MKLIDLFFNRFEKIKLGYDGCNRPENSNLITKILLTNDTILVNTFVYNCDQHDFQFTYEYKNNLQQIPLNRYNQLLTSVLKFFMYLNINCCLELNDQKTANTQHVSSYDLFKNENIYVVVQSVHKRWSNYNIIINPQLFNQEIDDIIIKLYKQFSYIWLINICKNTKTIEQEELFSYLIGLLFYNDIISYKHIAEQIAQINIDLNNNFTFNYICRIIPDIVDSINYYIPFKNTLPNKKYNKQLLYRCIILSRKIQKKKESYKWLENL